MINNIDQLWLRSFHCVYECNSFKKAADHLNLPTSNVSRHVALLEEKLSTRLLERTTRRITPTQAGEQLYKSTSILLTALNEALEVVSQNAQTIEGHLKILVPDIPVISDAIVSFCTRHPSVSLSCETSLGQKEELLDGFDLILRFSRGKLGDSGWVAQELFRLPSVVVASGGFLKKHGRPYRLDELSQIPCISTQTALNAEPWVFKSSQYPIFHQSVKSAYKVDSGHMARSAAIAGLGLAILPLDSCRKALETGQLEIVELEAEPEDLVLQAFYAGRKHLPRRVWCFIEHLKTYIKCLSN
ncbi:LysR family transcriptional regulator [Vibrio albus]|uniref:LysR family transcriptional regulator n=1 Tax=Vibrio albus TaxID=2200953 RepID=A0A2U3BAS5_9VIBR|nr:LysR family transcriptional regulator [Vibrio albus]PWI33825.1 LysR family transcriptional regulator [Vibrio albus]